MNYFNVLHQYLLTLEPGNDSARSTGKEFDALPLTAQQCAIAQVEMRRAERIAAGLVGSWRLLRNLAVRKKTAKPQARFGEPALQK